MPEPNPQTEKYQHRHGNVHRFQRDSCQRRLQLPRLEWETGRNGAYRHAWQYDYNTQRDYQPLRGLGVEDPPPEIPGDQKPNIEEANAKIRVQCIEYPSKHNPYKQNYRILPGSYDDLGWDRTEYGYIYSIRLNRAKYIAQFDQEIGRPHTDTEPNKETRINWRGGGGAWSFCTSLIVY